MNFKTHQESQWIIHTYRVAIEHYWTSPMYYSWLKCLLWVEEWENWTYPDCGSFYENGQGPSEMSVRKDQGKEE